MVVMQSMHIKIWKVCEPKAKTEMVVMQTIDFQMWKGCKKKILAMRSIGFKL